MVGVWFYLGRLVPDLTGLGLGLPHPEHAMFIILLCHLLPGHQKYSVVLLACFQQLVWLLLFWTSLQLVVQLLQVHLLPLQSWT